ncbi:MAG: transposase [Saprospiraceae bacterium]|nr:transposase [Saprospiraceae bacterium]
MQIVGGIIQLFKGSSSAWINKQGYMLDKSRFSWQRGFGAFSVDEERVNIVRKYIQRQEEHHAEDRGDRS